MRILKSRPVLLVTTALLGGALALAVPAAGAAGPAKGGHGSTTTTTTTKPGSSGGQSSAFATLVIKPASIGHVAVETAGTTTFQPGTSNEQLHVGDTVQTDSVGLAEIDYATNAWTRLNVNSTFTIKKLTDNQGNRQIDGGLTSGETWNRTTQLTQSESFQQDGGGVSAAVSGTAFVVDCTTPTQCTFTAVIDDTHLTGPNGQTQTLNPLTQCVTENSALCATPSMLTPDQLALIQWIQYNVYLDLAEHGIGTGVFQPFGATIVVNNGVVQSVTLSPAASPPQNNPGPSPACQVAPTAPPIVFDGSPGTGPPPATLGSCPMTAFGADPQPPGMVSSVAAPGGGSVTFSSPLNHTTVGSGWATWSNGYTGDVYVISGTSPVTLTMPSNTYAFSLYAEPDHYHVFTVTATTQDGTTSGAVPVNGYHGAQYFGFYTTSSASPILSVTVSTTDTSMAIGEFEIDQGPSVASTATTPPATTATTTPTTTPPTTATTTAPTTPTTAAPATPTTTPTTTPTQ
jgi:hypothetical protein